VIARSAPSPAAGHPLRGTLLALILGFCLHALGGCTSEADRLGAIAAQAPTNRAAAATALVEAYRAGKISHNGAIAYVTERLQDGQDQAAFGGAVLDFLDQVKADFKSDPEFELFWMGIGRLAFWSARAAYEHQRVDEALNLVFAGPKRWQNESYWLMYPDHDALASYILADAGRRGEAVSRLRNRSEVFDEAEEALRILTRGAN
jgi:hypothetical protein